MSSCVLHCKCNRNVTLIPYIIKEKGNSLDPTLPEQQKVWLIQGGSYRNSYQTSWYL